MEVNEKKSINIGTFKYRQVHFSWIECFIVSVETFKQLESNSWSKPLLRKESLTLDKCNVPIEYSTLASKLVNCPSEHEMCKFICFAYIQLTKFLHVWFRILKQSFQAKECPCSKKSYRQNELAAKFQAEKCPRSEMSQRRNIQQQNVQGRNFRRWIIRQQNFQSPFKQKCAKTKGLYIARVLACYMLLLRIFVFVLFQHYTLEYFTDTI